MSDSTDLRPVPDDRQPPRPTSPAMAVGTFFSFVLFFAGLALFAVSFDIGHAGAWTMAGGIVAIGLAFAIPTTILPAVEER